MTRATWVLALCLAVAALPAAANAQDDNFTNFETPQTKPLDIAVLGNGASAQILVLVCNTPDNSVEIYDARPPHAFIQRVPVGLGPSSVKWVPQRQSFYTCNFDGDSVSKVRLDVVPGPTGPTVFGALERTAYVGDQPADVSFDPNGNFGVVTLSGRSGATLFNAIDLSLLTADAILEGTDPAIGILLAVKAPRRIEWLPDNRLFVANFMGETPDPNTAQPTQYDFDLWFLDPFNPAVIGQVQGLGSTNHSFDVNSAGNLMVVAGTAARNHSAVGEAAVAALPFGFVESRIWVLDIPAGAQPTVRNELPGGVIPLPPVAASSHNLNRDYSALSATPVAPLQALSQPTDVEIIETGDGGLDTIAITAFHSDKVALLRPGVAAGGYIETQVAIPVLNPGAGYSTSGPRGLEFSRGTGLLYVACRLDNTLRVIDPVAGTVTASIQLNNDPTPNVVRQGRVFLYNASATSGSGFVSCASCHVDGTTDGLPWDLGDAAAGPAFPPGIIGTNMMFPNNEWPSEKGPLITQTLQGLVNYHTNLQGQYLFSNAPYHWRGDRASFNAFNPAFVGLLGRAAQLTNTEMQQYTNFINTVRHQPNPEQAIDRRVPGFLDPANPDDWQTATGVKLGLQIFHNFPTDGAFGCAGCHALPEGSDNTLTDRFTVAKTISGGTPELHPFETAQLRNLVPREMWLHRNPGLQGTIRAVANFGTFHNGGTNQGSINFFNNFFFSSSVPGNTPAEMQTNLEAVTMFTREFDWGTAPTVGIPYTINPADPFLNLLVFLFFEDGVHEANVGVSAIARQGQMYRGFWYDATVFGWREEGTSTVLSRSALEALASAVDSTVVLQATPLGSDRRYANPGGVATTLTGPAPSNVLPAPMAPMTYYTDIPLLQQMLNVDQSVVPPAVTIAPVTTLWALRTLQISVLGSFGVNALHHVPPRRFRVTGNGIRPGAKLLVGIPTTTPGAFPVQVLQLDLFPTNKFNGGDRIWETEEEMAPIAQYVMLNGGPFAPDTLNVALRQTTMPNLQPALWNSFAWAVLNEDGTINSTINFAPLTVQDTR